MIEISKNTIGRWRRVRLLEWTMTALAWIVCVVLVAPAGGHIHTTPNRVDVVTAEPDVHEDWGRDVAGPSHETPQDLPAEGELGPDAGDGEDPLGGLLSSFDGYTTLEEQCVMERRVVKLGAGDDLCPTIAGWSVQPLFAGYCVYQWSDTEARLVEEGIVELELGLGGLVSEPDCVVRSQGQGNELLDELAALYDEDLARGIGRLEPAQVEALFPGDPGAKVLVAIIDTAGRDPGGALDTHGRAMITIARDAASGHAPGLDSGGYDPGAPLCRRWQDWEHWQRSTRRVESFEGLPDQLASGLGSGAMGFRSDLALAIHDAVDCWLSSTPAGTKLVLNLSVGWEPGLGLDGGVGGAMVTEALLAARCRGAAVFAASGNRHPLACEAGPVGPASLGELEIEERCIAAGLPGASGRLLEPVSPVDHRGLALATEREESRAGCCALGQRVTGRRAGPVGRYTPMSGSSTATAVVSGMAALAWSYAPQLSVEELVALLYDSGEALATMNVAEIGTFAGETPHLLSVCGAMTAVCERRGAPCEQLCSESRSSVFDFEAAYGETVSHVSLGDDDPLVTIDEGGSVPYATTGSACGSLTDNWELTVMSRGGPPEPGSEELEDPVFPQPRRWPCSQCLVLGAGVAGATRTEAHLILTNDDAIDPADLDYIDIILNNAKGELRQIRYEDLPLSKDEIYIQPGPLCEVNGMPTASAYVSMTFDDGVDVEVQGNPIPVYCDVEG